MKCFIPIILTTCLIKLTNTLEYRDYDEEYPQIKKPVYDLKDAPEMFAKFIRDYNKKYKDEEDYSKHYRLFYMNLEKINELNQELEGALFGINMFADEDDRGIDIVDE